jgi:Txe/YoeB family toxin of Txe-Axe toxin-antitoxin module
VKVYLLEGAIHDLSELKLTDKNWVITKKAIQTEINAISKNPLSRASPPEIQDIVGQKFRQGLSQYHRVIYEILNDEVYVHIICHQSRDMTQILLRRMSNFEP